MNHTDPDIADQEQHHAVDITPPLARTRRARHRRPLAALATAASAALVGLTGSPAAGALTTRCVGFAEGVTVPGDLVVPANSSCSLIGVRIDGSVRVAKGADLVLDLGSAVAGDVRVAPGGFVDATESTIDGTLIGRGVFAAALDGATVGGDARFNDTGHEAGGPSLVSIELSDVVGSLRARTGELSVESSAVGGDLRADGATFVDVVDSTVAGELRVQRTEFGTFVCASEVYGRALLSENAYGVQLGGGGDLGACDGANFWGADVVIRDNSVPEIGVVLGGNIVAGALRGNGNSPSPIGDANRVRGGASGQFADLDPLPAEQAPVLDVPAEPAVDPSMPAPAIAARGAAVAEFAAEVTAESETASVDVTAIHTEAPVEDVIEQRRAAALASATAAGPAQL